MAPLILLVDDFEDALDIYATYLTYRGCRVVVARSGAEAIAAARQRRPDLILLDIRMPDISGIDAMKTLRADPSFSHVPIIALTAHAFADERSEALTAGFDEIIAKPCLPNDLFAAVERILNARPAEA